MAGTKKGRAAASAANLAPQMAQLRPVISADESTQTIYVNYAEVACSAHEFAILATRMPTKVPPDIFEQYGAGGVYPIAAEIQLLFSPTLIDGLITALTRQKEVYEQHFHKPEDRE